MGRGLRRWRGRRWDDGRILQAAQPDPNPTPNPNPNPNPPPPPPLTLTLALPLPLPLTRQLSRGKGCGFPAEGLGILRKLMVLRRAQARLTISLAVLLLPTCYYDYCYYYY